MSGRGRLLACGVSARALAQAAERAGWLPVVLDAYGDQDCAGEVHVVSPFTPRRAAAAAQALRFDAVAPAAGWEHAPSSLHRLGNASKLLASSPAAMRASRDPVGVARALRAAGLPSLITAAGRRSSPPPSALAGASRAAVSTWLRQEQGHGTAPWEGVSKPLHGGGGRGLIRISRPERGAAGRYLQEWRAGVPVSLIVAADGRRGLPLAVTRQLSGWPAVGAQGLVYAGSLLAGGQTGLAELSLTHGRGRAALEALADVLVRHTGLRGLVGVDGVLDGDGTFWLLEVNPRWCASFELLDQLLPTPLFGLHAAACNGSLPEAWLTDDLRSCVAGKVVVYHEAHLPAATAPDLSSLGLPGCRLADLPRIGTMLPPGGPICTVLATAGSETELLDQLLSSARHVLGCVAETLLRGASAR